MKRRQATLLFLLIISLVWWVLDEPFTSTVSHQTNKISTHKRFSEPTSQMESPKKYPSLSEWNHAKAQTGAKIQNPFQLNISDENKNKKTVKVKELVMNLSLNRSTLDSSPFQFHAEAIGGKWVEGMRRGLNAYRLSSSSALKLNENGIRNLEDFTISFWIKPLKAHSNVAFPLMIGEKANKNLLRLIYDFSNKNVKVLWGGERVITSEKLNEDQWNFIALIRKDSQLSLVINHHQVKHSFLKNESVQFDALTFSKVLRSHDSNQKESIDISQLKIYNFDRSRESLKIYFEKYKPAPLIQVTEVQRPEIKVLGFVNDDTPSVLLTFKGESFYLKKGDSIGKEVIEEISTNEVKLNSPFWGKRSLSLE